MKEPKIINVFLASSEELEDEREKFGNFIRQLNDIYDNRGINVRLGVWKDFNSAYHGDPKQGEYNKWIRESQMFLALFKTKAGKYTREEFDVAVEEYKRSRKFPQVYVYMKRLSKNQNILPELTEFKQKLDQEMNHYWTEYYNTDKLHFDFVMQFQRLVNDPEFKFDIDNGEVKVGYLSVANMSNLQFAANNKDYQEYKRRLEAVEQEIKDLESIPSNATIERMLETKHSELYQLQKQIKNFEDNLIEIAWTIASLQGEKSNKRLREATELFEAGKSREADAILNMKAIDYDVEMNLRNYKEDKKVLLSNIAEYRLKAKTVLTVYDNENRIAEAEEAYSKVVELAKEINMAEKDYIALLFEYEAFLRKYAIIDKALAIAEECLDLSIKINGEDNAETANAYYYLRTICSDNGDYRKALQNAEKSLEIRQRIFPEEHPDVALSYNGMGNDYHDIGDFNNSLKYHQKALAIREAVFGEDHIDTAMSYNNLGNVYTVSGDCDNALRCHEKALEITRKILGEDHPGVATSYNNLGLVYAAKGDYVKALEYHGKALALQKKFLGENNPDTAKSYSNIGLICAESGDCDNALKNYEQALAIQEKVLGKDHPEEARSCGGIGYTYMKMGDLSEAGKYYEKALQIIREKIGDDNPLTKTMLALQGQGKAPDKLPLSLFAFLRLRRYLL